MPGAHYSCRRGRPKVGRDRFYDRSGRYSYPIRIVLYNNKSMLGYFESTFYELGFLERLMVQPKEVLLQVVRHELAHYLAFIAFGDAIEPHGSEFKGVCKEFGWDASATICLETDECQNAPSDIIRKVEKLMALSTSSNPYEAELAMLKARELVLAHNIASTGPDEEKYFLVRVLQQKKESAKMRAIARILETFFVSVVYARYKECVVLELVGTKVNVEIAEYVALFLEEELEKLWKEAQKTHANLKGMVAKNSFFIGIAKGYCTKIEALKRVSAKEVTTALLVIEKKLDFAKSLVYSRLRATRSANKYCKQSTLLGELAGHALSIVPGLKQKQSQAVLLLS